MQLQQTNPKAHEIINAKTLPAGGPGPHTPDLCQVEKRVVEEEAVPAASSQQPMPAPRPQPP